MTNLHSPETEHLQSARQTQIAREIGQILPLGLPRVQRINDYPLNLGTMNYDQLARVYETCQLRGDKAYADSDTVALYMEALSPTQPTEELPPVA